MAATPTGYLIDEKSSDTNIDKLTFDKNLMLSHISSKSPDVLAEVDMKFLSTPQDLLVNSIDGDYRQSTIAAPTHVTMTTKR